MIFKSGPNPDEASALDMSARMTFESLKLRKAGKFNEAMAEGQKFSRDYGANKAVMMGLLGKCGVAQDANPDFQAAVKSGYLKALARMIQDHQT